MLNSIWVRNLLCFGDEDYRIDFAPETVIVGPNNVGKSAIIAAFNFLRTLSFGGWNFDTTSYSWGSPESAIHNHDRKGTVKIGTSVKGNEWSGQVTADFGIQSASFNLQPSSPNEAREEFKNYWYLRASRTEIPIQMDVGLRAGPPTPWGQPLDPDGSNAVTYLLERYTSRDPLWDEAESWLRRIVPEFSVLKTPLRARFGSIETQHGKSGEDINMHYQGTGTQKVLSTIAAVVFSPKGSTVIVEEPEIHLHPRSQEVLVDLFNTAVTKWGKQVIFTTHSWDMLLPFISDIGEGTERGKTHVKADPAKFKLVTFAQEADKMKIEGYDLKNKDFMKVRAYFKQLWG